MENDRTSLEDAGFLKPAEFIDSDHPAVRQLAELTTTGLSDEASMAIALYNAVRDGVNYDVYIDYNNPSNFRASGVLSQ